MLRLNIAHCSQAPKRSCMSSTSVIKPASKTSRTSRTPLHNPSCSHSGPTRLSYRSRPVRSQTVKNNAAPDDLEGASVQKCNDGTRIPTGPTASNKLAADARGFITTLSPEQHYKFQAALADLAQKLAAATAGTTPSPSSIGRAALADKPILSKLGSAPTAEQIRQILDDWADQYLTPDQAQPGSVEYNPKALSSSTLAKNLFKQLVLSLLPKADGAEDAINRQDLGSGKTLLATPAAAATAAAGASPGGAVAGSKPLGVTAVTPDGSKGPAAASAAFSGSFDPDVWEATAAAAAAAALEDTSLPNESSTDFKHNTTNATNASIAGSPNMNTASALCWPVKLLAQAAAAAAVHVTAADSSTKPTAGSPLISIPQLLCLPATAAADELREQSAVDRIGSLLLLCSGVSGSRGGQWLGHVLGSVREQLGLLEMGVLLAAVYSSFGKGAFMSAAQELLPLTHPSSDPLVSLTPPPTAPLPAAALQALLLHWLLLPQLAAARLPVLPEQELQQLLLEIVRGCSSRQLQNAARWGEVWPVTQLAPNPSSSSSSSSSGRDDGLQDGDSTAEFPASKVAADPAGGGITPARLQLQDPSVDATLSSSAWCGLIGVGLDHTTHVLVAAAGVLLPIDKHSSRRRGLLMSSSAAAADEVRAVARAVLMGFQPLQPMLLLLMHEVLLLPTAAAPVDTQQLLQLLLQAGSSTGGSLAVLSLGELIHNTLGNSSSGGSVPQQPLINAAVALLGNLSADWLQQELSFLLGLQQHQYWTSKGYYLKITPGPQTPCDLSPAVYQVLAAFAEAADPDQAALLLDVLPMPLWAVAWAVFVGPVSGSFCWSREQLTAVLARVGMADSAAAAAAWSVVAAHFALREVHNELLGTQQQQQQQQQQVEWSAAKAYTYKPGVPFLGDGWDQEGRDSSATSTAAAGSELSNDSSNCFAGSFNSFVGQLLLPLSAQAAALHIAALAAVLPADAFARLASYLLSSVTGDASYSKSLMNLFRWNSDLETYPLAVQLLAAAAPHLPLDQLPRYLGHASQITHALRDLPWIPGASPSFDRGPDHEIADPSDPDQQLDVIIAAAAVGRVNVEVQHMLLLLVDQLPVDQARAAVEVLGGGVSEAVLAEAMQKLRQRSSGSSSSTSTSDSNLKTGFEGEMVWQLGQTAAAEGAYAAAAAAVAAATSRDDHALVRRLSDIISDIPAAPPAGSWSMDAMQDPQRIASLLQQLLAQLTDWTPSCPSAAAAVGQLLTTLITKRRWTASEAGAVFQRLRLSTALQLLLEGSSTSSSSSWMCRNRSKLLGALIDWHGFEETVDAIRALFVGYNHASVADFAYLMADLQPALVPSSSSSSGVRNGSLMGAVDSPNAYIAAVLHVLGLMRSINGTAAAAAGSSSDSSNPAWSRQLSRVLCLLGVLEPDYVVSELAEQISGSLMRFARASSSSGGSGESEAAAAAGWQHDLANLLAELPAASKAETSEGYELWGLIADVLCAGAAAAAGGAAVLPALGLAVNRNDGGSSSSDGSKQVAKHLPEIMGQLEDQDLLTCSVGSSSAPNPASCINLQIVLLLQQLYAARNITLSTAVTALVTLAPTLGKALPQALVQVLGHPQNRGYGGLKPGYTAVSRASDNPDAAEALQGLQGALESSAAAAVLPTGAAVSTAGAVAGKQLSEVLAYCHEMLSDQIMTDLIGSLAAVIPWTSDLGSGSSSASSYSESSGFCPADTWFDRDGWQGVTQLQLITSSLLSASCAMWGVDKGPFVAQGIISKLVAAAAGGTEGSSSSSSTSSASGSGQIQNQASSSSSSSSSRGGSSTQKHAARADQALRIAAASGASTSSSSGSATQAARAEAALRRAAGDAVSAMPSGNHTAVASSSSKSHAQRATAALLRAAASGSNPSSSGATHSALAERKLLAAASGTGASSSSSQELLWAIKQLTAAAEHIGPAAAGGPGSSSSSSSAGLIASRAVISQLLATGYSAAAATAAAAGQQDTLNASTAAVALVAALPHVAATLPAELVVQVLVQCEDLVSPRMWQQGLAAAVAAAVAAAGKDTADGGAVPHSHGSDLAQQQQRQLLKMLITEVQLQLRVNARGPRLYAAVLRTAAAAAGNSEQQKADAIKPLLCLMLNGSGSSGSNIDSSGTRTNSFRGIPMSASAAAQLVLELAGSSSSRADHMPPSPACTSVQLLLLSQVVPAMLKHYSSSTGSSSSSLSLFVQCLADQITEVADPEQQMYLLLLLQPHITHNQLSEAVALTALAGSSGSSRGGALGGNTAAATTAAVAALDKLCNTSAVGKTLPLASYAELLSAALEVASSSSSGGVSFHEARVGLDLARRQQQQQLLGAVVSVFGTFRGMRLMHTAKDSPAAQLLLPLSDLAAVLCYSQMLLPAATAARLAAAVAAALTPEQLEKLLPMLPQAAADGFGKGAESWRPLLHSMAVVAGLPDAAEEGLARKAATAAAEQGIAAPVRIQGVPETETVDAGQQQNSVHFADPAAVNAALRGTHTAATADKQPAAAVSSHPIQIDDATPAAAAAETPADDLTETSPEILDMLAVVSLTVASVAATGAIAAGGAAGSLAWLAGCCSTLVFASLAASSAKGSSESCGDISSGSTSSRNQLDAQEAAAAAVAAKVPDISLPSPKTPTIQDSSAVADAFGAADSTPQPLGSSDGSSSRPGLGHQTVMGGRTKLDLSTVSSTFDTPAAIKYTAVAAAEAAAAASAAASSGSSILGSLSVDSDEMIRKIQTHAGGMPVDQAMIMVVPLLLQYNSSSSTWPVLAINAVLHAKHPALPQTMQGNMTAVNLAIAAALEPAAPGSSGSSSSSELPLASLLAASAALRIRAEGSAAAHHLEQQQQQRDQTLDDLLAAAEAVDPWAVSMQICSRLVNALWDALICCCSPGSSNSSSAANPSSSGYAVTTPDGAAAAWQCIVTDLLRGASADVAKQLLSGFINHSSSSWEAGLRALAVAAALQDYSNTAATACNSSSNILTDTLREVCSSRRYPPLAFIVLLLQQQQLPFSTSGVAVVLGEALQQLLAAYGVSASAATAAAAAEGFRTGSSSSSSGEDSLFGTDSCDFDPWGFGELFWDLDLFGDQPQQQQHEGPQYKPTSAFGSSPAAAAAPAAAVPEPAMHQVAAVVKAACARGYAIEALDFLMCLLLLVNPQQQPTHSAAAGLAALRSVGSSSSGLGVANKSAADGNNKSAKMYARGRALESVLVLDADHMRMLLTLAADCCCAALASSSSSALTAALLPTAIPDLVAVLGDYGDVDSCIKLAAAVCEAYKQKSVTEVAKHRSSKVAGTADSTVSPASSGLAGNVDQAAGPLQDSSKVVTLSWVDACLVGKVLAGAAAAAAGADGSSSSSAASPSSSDVSCVKAYGSKLLTAASTSLFGGVAVEQCLVTLSELSVEIPVKLGLQLVSASAAKLHSVMPQAVAIVRSGSSSSSSSSF